MVAGSLLFGVGAGRVLGMENVWMWPQYNPVAVQLGPLALHWYGLAYVVSLLGALWLAKRLAVRAPAVGVTPQLLEDLFGWVVLGVIAGGRLGYILFYDFAAYMAEPLRVLMVWQGGMSFHGGMLGVVLAVVVFCKRRGVSMVDVGDRIAPVVPLGIALGRLANWVNGELWGRVADPAVVPWAVIFPHVDSLPRHPSQLYEMALEGVLLGLVMGLVVRKGVRKWLPIGVFCVGYALARSVAEQFREPEIVHWGLLTHGQMLSLPLLIFGLFCVWKAYRAK